jgi:hypothetical protein
VVAIEARRLRPLYTVGMVVAGIVAARDACRGSTSSKTGELEQAFLLEFERRFDEDLKAIYALSP